jgi:fibronectin-binding autotransporter adhesin
MGKARWLVLGVSVALFASAGAIAACGGDEAAVGQSGDGGADGTTPGTDQDSGATTTEDGGGGGGGDTGTTTEAGGGDGGGGGLSNPGKITCGPTECNTTGQTCCTTLATDGGGSTCEDGGGNQCQGQTLPASCDEKADCADGGLCCLAVGGNAAITCRAACNNNRIQICKTNAECVSGDAGCQAYTCPNNRTIRSCTKPLGCN